MSSDPTLFVLTALGIGGTERKTVAVTNALHDRGWNVHLTYLDDRTPLLKRVHEGVPVTHLQREGKISKTAITKLRRYITEQRVPRMVCVGLYPLLYAWLARLFLRDKPEILLLHNTTDNFDRKMQLQMNLYRPIMRRAARIIFGCRAQMDRFVEEHGFDRARCDVIYNGIDASRFEPRTVEASEGLRSSGVDIADDDFLIGAVGTLWPNKNHIELINVLRALKNRLPNAKLVVAGEGPERQRLEEAAREGGIADRVMLIGEIEDVRPLLERTDVFILPSVSETFSNATLEAMAMNKVVVSNDTGGMGEMIRHGVDGFVYNIGDIDYLAGLVEELAGQPERRRELGAAARAAVLERFTFDRMVDDYQAQLDGLVAAGS